MGWREEDAFETDSDVRIISVLGTLAILGAQPPASSGVGIPPVARSWSGRSGLSPLRAREVGALAILLAYAANRFGWTDASNLPYQVADLAGSAILRVVAVIEFQLGFVLLEGFGR